MSTKEINNFVEQMSSIVFNSFKDKQTLTDQVKYMFNHPYEKWYNIISVFNSLSTVTMIRTLNEWSDYNINDIDLKQECGIPYIQIYQEEDEDNAMLVDRQHIINVFDISQLHLHDNVQKNICILENPVQDYFENKNDYLNICDNWFWIDFVKTQTKKNKFVQLEKNEEINNFILDVCLIASEDFVSTGINLNMCLVKDLDENKLKEIYFSIYNIVSNLFNEIKKYFDEKIRVNNKLKHDKLLEQRKNRTLKIRIQDAKKSLENNG